MCFYLVLQKWNHRKGNELHDLLSSLMKVSRGLEDACITRHTKVSHGVLLVGMDHDRFYSSGDRLHILANASLCTCVFYEDRFSEVELMSQRELPFRVDRLLNCLLKVFNNIHFHQ